VAADGLGDAVGLVLVVVGVGLDEGDWLGLVVVGLALGEVVGVPEGEGLVDPGVVVQLRVGDGVPLEELLAPRWLEEVAVLLNSACRPPLPPPPGPFWLLFLAGAITWGSAAIANEAAATTNAPVATAAAGRSHPNQPMRPGRSDSGRNLSATTPAAYRTQMTAGSSRRKSDHRTTIAPKVRHLGSCACALAEILALIRSSPSAPGSIESAASRSALRSAPSSTGCREFAGRR